MHQIHREGLHLLTHRKHSKYLKKDLDKKIIFFLYFLSALRQKVAGGTGFHVCPRGEYYTSVSRKFLRKDKMSFVIQFF